MEITLGVIIPGTSGTNWYVHFNSENRSETIFSFEGSAIAISVVFRLSMVGHALIRTSDLSDSARLPLIEFINTGFHFSLKRPAILSGSSANKRSKYTSISDTL